MTPAFGLKRFRRSPAGWARQGRARGYAVGAESIRVGVGTNAVRLEVSGKTRFFARRRVIWFETQSVSN